MHAIRKGGFDGAIRLELRDAPKGLTLDRAVIPAGASEARITASVSGRSDRDVFPLEVEGTAEIGSRTVSHRAVPAEDMMQAFIYRHLVPADELLVMVTEPEPVAVTLELPKSGVIEARPGGKISIPAAVVYHGDTRGFVQLELSDPPEWLTLKSKGIGGARPMPVELEVSTNAEVGDTATILLNAKISIAKPETDPTYNPVLKWQNRKTVTVTIAAIPVKIIN